MTMVNFILVPGAGGGTWYWNQLVPELRARGHEAIPVDLPTGDESAGLAEYTDSIIDTIGDRDRIILVAQSMAGFSAPQACARVPVDLLIMLNAMTPAPGETPGEWWANTGQQQARIDDALNQGRPTEFDPIRDFFHDVPTDLTAEAMAAGEPPQADLPFSQPWPLTTWPDVPTRFLQGRDDRLFPLEFQRRLVKKRLGIPVDELPGGHLLALSQPIELAGRLTAYLNPADSTG
ncbi:MAG TPA: alpha/beta hydrolase [Pseudonocardiaceae bacterium]|nr:alpha/beta hydrolase [Pseudonocardiaceae bacterium]